MPRVSKSPEDRQHELVDAAEVLFGAKGYVQTAVSDIVKHVGVSQGTFYYYFKSKSDIADALAERIALRVFTFFKDETDGAQRSPAEKLTRLFNLDLQGFDHDEGMGSLFAHLHREENALLHQKLIARIIERFAPMVAAWIEQGKHEKVFLTEQNALYAAEFLLIGYQFWMDAAFFQRSEEERKQRIGSLGGMIETLLAAKPGTIPIAASRPTK